MTGFSGRRNLQRAFVCRQKRRTRLLCFDRATRGLETSGAALKTPKSSDECFAAYSRLLAGFNGLVDQLELPRTQLLDRYTAEVVDRRVDLEALYARLADDFPESKSIYTNLRSTSRQIWRELGEWDLSVPLADLLTTAVHGHRDELLVQVECHKVLEEQFSEQRDLILVERNFATKHLMPSYTKPVVDTTTSNKAVRLDPSRVIAVPVEIAAMIYSPNPISNHVSVSDKSTGHGTVPSTSVNRHWRRNSTNATPG